MGSRIVRLPFCPTFRTLPCARAGPASTVRPAARMAAAAIAAKPRRIVFIEAPPLVSCRERGRIPFRPPAVLLLLRDVPEHRHRRHNGAVEAGAHRGRLITLAEIDVSRAQHPVLLQVL